MGVVYSVMWSGCEDLWRVKRRTLQIRKKTNLTERTLDSFTRNPEPSYRVNRDILWQKKHYRVWTQNQTAFRMQDWENGNPTILVFVVSLHILPGLGAVAAALSSWIGFGSFLTVSELVGTISVTWFRNSVIVGRTSTSFWKFVLVLQLISEWHILVSPCVPISSLTDSIGSPTKHNVEIKNIVFNLVQAKIDLHPCTLAVHPSNLTTWMAENCVLENGHALTLMWFFGQFALGNEFVHLL